MCVCMYVVTGPVPSNDMLQLLHGPTCPPPPLIHAQNCARCHNGDVSYTYTGILSSQSSVSVFQTLYCAKKNFGPAKGGGGIAQCPPPLNTPLSYDQHVCLSVCLSLSLCLSVHTSVCHFSDNLMCVAVCNI